MLTLEQVRAVNDGFAGGDLNAALAPLEETIDLRAAELPRLDKKALTALKDGLANRDDAATWAQAILHPNISVRRFARKIFMGLGDEAAPIFDPLRARLERFWNEEEPLPETSKPREAALRREQREQVESALEILLRADPEKFMEFYAHISDNTPANNSHVEQLAETRAWSERNQNAYRATQEETTRLLKAEWGEKFASYSERWKLPSRVLREMDERARAKPEIAKLWVELGENPWEAVAPTWNPKWSLMHAWNGYLDDYQPTGPTKRVAARLRPILYQWVGAAFDFGSDVAQRERTVERLGGSRSYYGLRNWLDSSQWFDDVPMLLIEAKKPLLPIIKSTLKAREDYQKRQDFKGEETVAELWITLAIVVGNACFRPYNITTGNWEKMPDIAPETLRALALDLTDAESNQSNIGILIISAEHLEAELAARAQVAPAEVVAPEQPRARHRFQLSSSDALAPALLQQIEAEFNNAENGGSYAKARIELDRHAEIVAEQIVALDDETRLARLIMAPHPNDLGAYISRANYLNLWTRDMEPDEETQWQAKFFERAESDLWARLETQLDAHRKIETEPIEPDIEQKLTANETKEWRTRVRREKRAVVSRDAQDIVRQLAKFGGVAAWLRAIALADRPGCRDIRDQLEGFAAMQLESRPGDSWDGAYSAEAWENWKLDEQWDPIIEKLEARLPGAGSGWERNAMERQLATGYYRRGDLAGFERYAKNPDTFPHVVSMAVLDDENFEAWRILLAVADSWQSSSLKLFWDAQIADEARKSRAIESVTQVLATTNLEKVAKSLLDWVKPLDTADFAPYISEIEDALESAIVNIKKWAMAILSALPDSEFDRERAAQTASESLWSENAGLAKDAAKFLSVLALQDENAAELAWDSLNDATSLENIGLCEAVFKALVKIKSKRKSLELSDAAREKLDLLSAAQSERFGKFGRKLTSG